MNYELRIKYLKQVFIILLLSLFIFNSLMTGQDNPVRSGSIIFLEMKCERCHSIKSQAIECSNLTIKSFTDLSTVGDSLETEIIKDYLLKKVKLNNKKHPVAFKGKKEDLKIMCNWLQNLSSVLY